MAKHSASYEIPRKIYEHCWKMALASAIWSFKSDDGKAAGADNIPISNIKKTLDFI